MSDTSPSVETPADLLAAGRRHLAVRDYNAAAEFLAKACEALAAEHGEKADQCAEAYLWYGKALLGLSREESGVLGDGVPSAENAEEEEDDDDEQENGVENGKHNEASAVGNGVERSCTDSSEAEPKTVTKPSPTEDEPSTTEAKPSKVEAKPSKSDPESSKSDSEPSSSSGSADDTVKAGVDEEPGPSNGEANDESVVDMENEDDIDNLQLAWEMLDLARSILLKRSEAGGGDAARALLADAHLTLGEVALESETYDKAVSDMQSCLDIQKELYRSDDRRIAETHYQIGLANSLASSFEDAITHFKNAANILESRIKTLENPATATEDATVKKYTSTDPLYSVEGEIRELKELLPEIQEKIQDMMEYKAETIRRVRESLCGSNGDSVPSQSTATAAASAFGAGSSSGPGFSSSSNAAAKPAASDISHLIKRKRKSSETAEAETSAAKRTNT